MNRQSLFISKLMMVFLFCSAFVGTDDTIIKGRTSVDISPAVLPVDPTAIKTINVDSLLIKAKETINDYNNSVDMKNRTSAQLLQQNRRFLEYDKKETALLKAVIAKKRTQFDMKEPSTLSAVDSICSKYKRHLFSKKKCVEYTMIYTLNIDNKTIKLKEMK